MAVARVVEEPAWSAREWPMTRQAWEALDADAATLARRVQAEDGYTTGRLDGDADAPSFVPNVVGQQLARQLTTVKEVLAGAVVVEDPELAVIGRRVTLTEADGAESTYALVIPGEGDPRNGWVSVDSPVGSALLGRRVGEMVTISAPSGAWTATISRIE